MNILLLGPTPEKLLPCIESRENVVFAFNEAIDGQFVLEKQINVLVSYNYRFIIRSDVLSVPEVLAVNLHTSLLPFNRGAHPVLWSILEGTPLGVTIHQINEGLDTGPIIFQKPLGMLDAKLSLRQAYDYVNQELVDFFCIKWPRIIARKFNVRLQQGVGTFHKSAQARDFLTVLENSWESTIEDAKRCYADYSTTK